MGFLKLALASDLALDLSFQIGLHIIARHAQKCPNHENHLLQQGEARPGNSSAIYHGYGLPFPELIPSVPISNKNSYTPAPPLQ